jgi:hypothetical protein
LIEADEALGGGVIMYHPAKVIIKLSAIEIQKAMAIDLNEDSFQARQFIKKKIVDQCFQAPSRLDPGAMPGSYP